MRGFGYLVLVLGVLGLIAALNMDVSVSSGFSRVNNLGLMAERQNYTIVAGLAVLVGLIMVVFGRSGSATTASTVSTEYDTRPCPLCAETIKRAAVKCKHCGSDIEAAAKPLITPVFPDDGKGGWTVRFDCASKEQMEHVKNLIAEMSGVIRKDDGMTVITGFFQEKDDAKDFRNRFAERNGTSGELYFQLAEKFNI